VQVESQRGGVLRSSNWIKGSRDTEKKGRRGIKLTSSLKCERSIEISRVSQLLLVVYQGFCQSNSTVVPTSKEGRKVEMEKRVEGNILEYQKSIYIRTSTSSTRSRQRNADQS